VARGLPEGASNIPPDRTSFVGRATELASIEQAIGEGAPLVTVTGFAGTGKTRIARRFAGLHAAEFSGGAWFVDLTSARSLPDICAAVGLALRIPITSGGSLTELVDQVGHAVAARGSLLLVLDNFEQVVDEAPGTLARWLDLAAEATWIVTSRERLRLSGETCLALEPLPVPPVGAACASVMQFDAVELFLDRARALRRTVTTTDGELIASIVRKLDGIPLAIELCATRVGVLGLTQLVSMLDSRLRVLGSGARDADPRQATLRRAIDWSWDLLEPWEKDALAQCSVFRGGFSFEAAAHVLDMERHGGRAPPEAFQTLELLQALCDKSLLRSLEPAQRTGGRRFDLLECIREYGAERLTESGAANATAERHARWFVEAGTRWAGDVDGPDGANALADLVVEAENLLSVRERAEPALALASLVALEPVAFVRGPLVYYAELLQETLAACEGVLAPAETAGALLLLGLARARTDRLPDAIVALESARSAAEAAQDMATLGGATSKLAVGYAQLGQTERAEQAAELARSVLPLPGLGARRKGTILDDLGVLAFMHGKPEASIELHESAIAELRKVGCERGAVKALAGLANAHLARGDHARAQRGFEEALVIARHFGDRLEGWLLNACGALAHDQGQFDRARILLEESLAINRRSAARLWEASSLLNLACLDLETRRLSAARQRCRQALALFDAFGHMSSGAYVVAVDAAALALEDQVDEASRGFDDADARLRTASHPPRYLHATALLREHLTLARARVARAAGDAGAAERARRRVSERVSSALAGETPRADEVRFAIRTLEAAPATDASTAGVSASAAPTEHHDLWLDVAAARVVVDGARVIDLRAKPLLARLLAVLLTSPAKPMEKDRLFREVWTAEFSSQTRGSTLYKAVDRLARLLSPEDPRRFLGWDEQGRVLLRAKRPRAT